MLSIIIHRFKQTNGSISAFSEIRKYEFDYKAFILVTFDGPRWHVILDKEILLAVKKKKRKLQFARTAVKFQMHC